MCARIADPVNLFPGFSKMLAFTWWAERKGQLAASGLVCLAGRAAAGHGLQKSGMAANRQHGFANATASAENLSVRQATSHRRAFFVKRTRARLLRPGIPASLRSRTLVANTRLRCAKKLVFQEIVGPRGGLSKNTELRQ